jgi:hypothetical protein
MRAALQFPAGWEAATEDAATFDELRNPVKSHTIDYLVQPPEGQQSGRENFAVQITGTWRNLPFRMDRKFAVGHDPIQDWLVIGPFDNKQGEGLDFQYQPELNVMPDKTYEGLKQQVQWKNHSFPNGYVDFDALYDPDDFTVAYGYVGIYSPRQQIVRFELGCNGDVKVFQNYNSIYKKRNINALFPSGEVFYHKLFQGWNHIIVKVSERAGPWGFYLEVTDVNGQTIPELRYSLEKY